MFWTGISSGSFTPAALKSAIIVVAGGVWGTHIEFTLVQVLAAILTHVATSASAVISIRVIRACCVISAGRGKTMVNGRCTCRTCEALVTYTFKVTNFILARREVFTGTG